MIRRTLREWQRIGYGDDEATIPQAEADRIAAVAARSAFAGRGGEGVLEHGRKALRARGVVGVIAAPGCQLEILPKIEGLGEHEATDDALRRRLIHMLAVVHDLRIDTGAMTQLGWQKDTVLELLIRLFCTRLLEAVRMGLPRRYLEHADDLSALRGRLDITRQFSRHAVSPQRLACSYDELSFDIPLNQIMRAAVSRLQRLAQAADNQRLLREIEFAYSDVTRVPVAALRWDQITLDRTNQRWSELLSFARLLLTDRHQQTSAGAIDGHALLFEMNALFEQYIAKLLTRALSGSGYRVSAQGGHRDCLFEENTGRFRTKPDLIIRQGDRTVLVIDTKWKRMAARIDDPKQGVSQADVYQLMAYSQLYQCQNVMLLYPHHSDLPPDPIRTCYAIANADAKENLVVATLDVTGSSRAHVQALEALVQVVLSKSEAA
ncbi:restriction endonuclease [Salipiger aestuarii]|uniref:McrC family protein n=1 Tax=Salipiger aestuarii TaxID=568098 RepID=UPI00123ADAEE|nr:restriction endonuclease [Salipiger aestuarii]KAA8605492.1 restriction endonuclease [Salipiger aestuarii]